MYIHTYLYIMFIHEIWIRYGRSKMDVTFKVNQLFKGEEEEEEEEEKSSWRARSRARLMPVFTRSSFRTSVGRFIRVCACARACVCVCVGTLFKCHTKKSGKSNTKRCGGIKPQTGSSARRVLLYFFLCGMSFCNILKYIVAVSILYILRRAPDDYSC